MRASFYQRIREFRGWKKRTSAARQAAEKVSAAKKSGAKSRGIPHLAKNERDMGHPGSFWVRMKKTPQGLNSPGARAKRHAVAPLLLANRAVTSPPGYSTNTA